MIPVIISIAGSFFIAISFLFLILIRGIAAWRAEFDKKHQYLLDIVAYQSTKLALLERGMVNTPVINLTEVVQ